MLVSQDLMHRLAQFVEPPAQLCLIRVLGSDHEYVFRVRCGDVHLDYPVVVPLLDSSYKVEQVCNWDEVAKTLAVMGAMVVSPEARAAYNADRYRPSPHAPQVLAPMRYDISPYWS